MLTLACIFTFSIGVLLCVYLYSLAGVSRSVTLVVAYIMTVTSLGWEEALAAVRVVRPCACPNLSFQRQLQEFEATQAEQVSGTNQGIHTRGFFVLHGPVRVLRVFGFSEPG